MPAKRRTERGGGRFYMDRANLPCLAMDMTYSTFSGDKAIENLDEYLEELRALSLDEVIGVYQARYDRFKGK